MTSTSTSTSTSASASTAKSQRIRVGIIGAGEVTQVVHLPTLAYLFDRYVVTALCDVSAEAVAYSASKWGIARTYTSSAELVASPDVDLVLIANSDEYHVSCALDAARAGKHVFIEKPMALTHRQAQAVHDAAHQHGVKIYVGYMRRYAPAFDEFRRLLRDCGPIRHAIVKDIVGPNAFFVAQSATEPRKFVNDIPADAAEDKARLARDILVEALGDDRAASPRLAAVYRLLGSLGSHDLSFMREALGGPPTRCTSAFASHDGQFISAQFEYHGRRTTQASSADPKHEQQPPFSVLYTTGIHNVGVFESFLEVYTDDRILRIDIDTPYVKGLPLRVTVKENDERGIYSERIVRTSYKDAYTAQFEQLHDAITTGTDLKTTPADAAQDLVVFDMIMQKLEA
ncbi:uncharacterized protein PFL1_06575 [Pseudozyma flocculosa PF-1]|uniref:Gfo/Idh/MocA-like oxidoreductase N-terminal domain-containing protein n=2 Tax=Pseudozyma flocculosa TaxID=84751 RepID=A0A5C3FA25_9BASI|nr:uncharacterized protein PFL1_06575 [Pseudozyma flocculosa PF-1]EPQ25902.1 hypothetical protein PFL1_06575 [Pseudozyma flocculosa PF-1]SPO40597.1 uncharacterized protein PSFLO_06079 [Pseudozyma flocculosa]